MAVISSITKFMLICIYIYTVARFQNRYPIKMKFYTVINVSAFASKLPECSQVTSFCDQGVFVHVITEFIKPFLIILSRNFAYTRTYISSEAT